MPHSGRIAESPPGALVVEAQLSTGEIQELADQIGELKRLATEAGAQLAFRLHVEVNGSQTFSDENVAKLNAVLQKVSGNLKLSR